MRKRLFITISDSRVVRQYAVHGALGKLLMYALSGHALVLVLGLVGMGWMAWEMSDLYQARQSMVQEVKASEQALNQQRGKAETELTDLQKQIQRKREELGIINRVAKPAPSSGALPKPPLTPERTQAMKPHLPTGSPLVGASLSSTYGMRFHPVWMKNLFHHGIDFAVAENTPVRSTADGVVDAITQDPGGFGLLVSIRHTYKFKTIYAHLNKAGVHYGQVVRKGEVIAYSGNTGLSTGPHLHYEVRYDDQPLNPRPFMVEGPNSLEQLIKQARNVPWESLVAYRLL